jgi:hypothetical protein
MKTARITFLSTPEFKAGLEKLARRDAISVGELVRRRFSVVANAEERELAELAAAVRLNAVAARTSLAEGLAELEKSLKALRPAQPKPAATRPRAPRTVAARPARRKVR